MVLKDGRRECCILKRRVIVVRGYFVRLLGGRGLVVHRGGSAGRGTRRIMGALVKHLVTSSSPNGIGVAVVSTSRVSKAYSTFGFLGHNVFRVLTEPSRVHGCLSRGRHRVKGVVRGLLLKPVGSLFSCGRVGRGGRSCRIIIVRSFPVNVGGSSLCLLRGVVGGNIETKMGIVLLMGRSGVGCSRSAHGSCGDYGFRRLRQVYSMCGFASGGVVERVRFSSFARRRLHGVIRCIGSKIRIHGRRTILFTSCVPRGSR